MALIIDLDDLNQGNSLAVAGAIFATGTGADIRIHTAAANNLPALAAGEFFEVRDHADAENNGLFVVVTVTTSTDDYECDKVTATAPIVASAEAITVLGATGTASEKSVHFDVNARNVFLLEQGNLSVDGVTLQALYSFIKVEWKADDTLIPHPFPMIAITPEQFEFIDDWNPQDDTGESIQTRKLIRSGGWSEVSETGTNLLQQYAGVISLGTFEDTLDTAYSFFGTDETDTGAAVDFTFSDAVNEAVQVYNELTGPDGGTGFAITTSNTITRNDGGDWSTDGYVVGGQITIRAAEDVGNNGTFTLTSVGAGVDGAVVVSATPLTNNAADTTMIAAVDNRNSFDIRLRIRDGDVNGKVFDSSNLTAIGITGTSNFNNRVFRFPLANATDLKIAETDANIDANTPYTEMQLRFLDETYNREVDSVTKRDFGIILDIGTYSEANGVSASSTLFTSADIGNITLGDYTGGTLFLHEQTDQGTHTISGTPVDNAGTLEVTLTGALTASETNISFTLQRSTPVIATAEEIYEFVQRQLRRDIDIDDTGYTAVVGRTADELLAFVGDSLNAGSLSPTNAHGGGSGVFIEGFDSNDTNRLFFFDNAGTSRQFPFVAAGTINFNANLQNDTGPAEFFMFFEYTERFTNTGFGISAVTLDAGTLDSSVTDLVAELADGDYIRLSGFVNDTNNGIFVLTGAPAGASPWTAAVRKIDGETLIVEAAGPSVSLDKNPIDSPDAILVDDNSGTDITGTISGPSVGFDFDYDNNVQGGRTAGTDADIVIRALGEDVAAFVEVFGTITRATGLVFSIVAPLERNFSNPV